MKNMKRKNGIQTLPGSAQMVASSNSSKVKSVRGSGYTYDEGRERTDKSVKLTEVELNHVVKLPDLGKPEPK
jgi:hypothetical protein